MVMDRYEPRWQPISELPMIATLIDNFVDETQGQWCTLSSARDERDPINEKLLEAVAMVYAEHSEHAKVFREQLIIWQRGSLDQSQADTVSRLLHQVRQLNELSGRIVTLTAELYRHCARPPAPVTGSVPKRQTASA